MTDIDTLRQEEAAKRAARNEVMLENSLRFGRTAEGEYFAEQIKKGAELPAGAHAVTLSFKENEQGQPVIADIHLQGEEFAAEVQKKFSGESLEKHLHVADAEVFGLNMSIGNTVHEMYLMDDKVEAYGPEAEKIKDMVAEFNGAYMEMTGEQVMEMGDYAQMLQNAPERVAERESALAR